MDSSVNWFRKIALAEGVSFLLLLLVAMPLKYVWNFPEAVKFVGWGHGILFIIYIPLALGIKETMKWQVKDILIVLIAALVPAGPFILDGKMLRKK